MNADIFEERRWLARVRADKSPNGQVVGTAFAFDARRLLTCAHVVNSAGGSGPGSKVMIDMVFDGPRTFLVTVLRDGWRPAPTSDEAQSKGDTAVLEIPGTEPPLTPLPLANRRALLHASVATYGFPVAHPESNSAEGVLGRPVGLEWIRIEQHAAALIEPGFSGAPVWSDDIAGVIGMVVTRDSAGARSAYAIPVSALAINNPHVDSALDKSAFGWRRHVTSGVRTKMLDQRVLLEERGQDFVGRINLQERVRSWLSDPGFPSGYIFIEGEPGIGKSAVLAHMAMAHGYPYHFNVYTDNVRSPVAFLVNTCAQLIARYDLPFSELAPDAGSSAAIFLVLLARAREATTGPIVILVDALDESEPAVDRVNRLNLPSRLPPGCFIIATNRSGVDRQIDTSTARELVMHEASEENEADIRGFVMASIDKHPYGRARLLQQWGVDEVALTDAIWAKSEGNFMYVKHALAELFATTVKQDQPNVTKVIEALPQGLRPYYERHWRLMQSDDGRQLRHVQKPIICFLATAKEAVSARMITDWMNESGFDHIDEDTVREVLTRDWAQFIHLESGADTTRYRLYHKSFLEFLESKIEFNRCAALVADVMARRVDFDESL